MSEEIKPKKERKFLKALGKIGEVLIQELFFRVGSNLIRKIGGKKPLPSILFIFLSLSLFAQFPNTLNKQRLGFQTTGDGLTWRGSISDTASIQPINNQNAWVILDTINLKFYSFDFTSNVWNLVGGSAFEQPVDSLFFNVNVPTNNVDTAKMRWDSDLATVVLGLNDNVPNELGFKNFWLVKNQTGSTITKGSLVYANGTVGASGRITVAKFIANGSIDAKYLLGITAHDLSNGEDGYVISFGKIRQVNTDTFAAGAILYPSPTVAGVWTDVEPIAPNIDMPIGFCINSSVNNGTIAIRVASGYKLSELHDVAISSPIDKASLYYSGGLWRDTTAALLVSDTASMLANYATKEYADTTGRLYARQDFTNVSISTLTWTQTDTLIPGGVNVVQVYRNGQILLPNQYTIPTSTSIVIAATSFKVGENYTVIFPRGGGAGSGGGSGSLTSISGGTGILVSPDPITTTGTVSADLSVLMELTDTTLLNLTSRFNTKQNTLVSGTNIKTVNSNSLLGSGNISVGTLVAADTVSLSNRINTKLNTTDTASLSNRINLKLNATDTASLSNRINLKGSGTVTSVATGYGLSGGAITTTGTLLLDSAVVFSRIRDSIVDVAIGTDTIKILKQEYAPATTSVLTWTITPKFPIQLKAYILVFRNGQLLINDQYNLTDTNKITIVSNSFKVGANYTVVTVSGIGSVGTGVFPNPVYPEAGIAVSTGSAWASSVPNNSSNWNIAFNDKITNAAFSGTTTKTLTLTQYDGGTFAPTFTDLQGVTGVTAGTGLTGGTITTTGTVAVDFTTVAPLANPTFTGTVSGITKSMVGLGNVDNTSDANKPISTATQTALNLKFNTADTTLLNLASRFATKLNYTDTSFLFTQSDTNQLNLTSRFALKANLASPTFTGTVSGITKSMVGLGNVDNTSDANKPISTATQTALNLKVNISDTASMLTPYLRRADTSLLNLTSRFNTKLNLSDTSNMLVPYLRKADTTNMLSPYFRDADTSLLNLTSRFASKLNLSDTASMLTNYLRSGVAASTYQTKLTNPVTGTGTNNYIPKFTTTGSTIGNSTLIDNGTTISTASILSTTNYAALDAGNNTHRLTNTLSGNQTWTPSAGFLTSYFNNNVSGGWYYNTLVDNSGFPILSILSTSNDRKKSGITLNSQGTANGTYSPAITFSSLSNSTAYYSAYAAIIGKKTGTGGPTGSDANWNTGHIEFYGTTQATDVNGGVMLNSPSMTLGVGVGIGYDAPPTIKGRLTVLEKLGINQSTPAFALDVSGTANITGATTLGSTLTVTNAVTLSTTTATPASLLGKDGSNVVGTVTLGNTLTLTSGTLNVNNKITDINTSTYIVLSSDYYIDNKNSSSTTIILPLAGLNTFRELKFKNSSTGALIANGNIIPLSGSGTTTTILSATNAKWCTLVSDGTDWRIMESN